MPHRNRVVVVDDKLGDGESIIRRLWKLQVPSYFFHYAQDSLDELNETRKLDGIRVIFQDIELVPSGGVPTDRDYGAAASALNRILADENGPWLMVAWSTWGDDPDTGDKYAKELFEYLRNRLPKGKRPYNFVVLDKTPYTCDGIHGGIKTESEFTSKEKSQLLSCVEESIRLLKSMEALSHWEANIRSSASRVVNNLWDMIQAVSIDEIDPSLGALLFKMAQAQEGSRILISDDISAPLYQILSSLLHDRAIHAPAKKIKVEGIAMQNINVGKINSMLHWEAARENSFRSPGCVYEWPIFEGVDMGSLSISENNVKEFIIDAFVADDVNKRNNADSDTNFLDNVKLVVFDITPACDYANNKAFWRRFLVGIMVLDAGVGHFYSKGRKNLAGPYLKSTPEFMSGDTKFRFIFNSKLVLSLNDKGDYLTTSAEPDQEHAKGNGYTPDIDKLKIVGRIREQMLQDFLAWYGGMATRPGIVSL